MRYAVVSREPLIVSPDDFVTAAQLQLVTYAENIHRLDTEDLHLERIALLQEAEELAACVKASGLDDELMKLADSTNFGKRESVDDWGRTLKASPELIVLHETVISGPATVNLFQTPHPRDDDQVSYHMLIATDGARLRIVPDQNRAYGSGMSAFGDATQRRQPGHGIFEVMQDPTTVDVVELAEVKCRDLLDRAVDKARIGQAARFNPRLRDVGRGPGDIQMDDLRVDTRAGMLLRQHDGGIARPATGHKDAERARSGTRARENVMIDLRDMAGRAGHQPFRLVRGIAGRIGVILVLLAQIVVH